MSLGIVALALGIAWIPGLVVDNDDPGGAHQAFLLETESLGSSPAWTAEGDLGYAHFGYSVASAGDVNGDGYGDVIVGARIWHDDPYQLAEGRAYVYHGSATGLGTSPAWTAEGNLQYAEFGYSVASAGDVNGDGYGDVIVGAPFYRNGEWDEGRAFVYHGSATGLGTSPAWTAESNLENAFFGISVASAGDVNGDGFADVIIGAQQYENGQADEGRAFVYHGSATGLGTSPAWTAEPNQAGAVFGQSVASAGNVNGDGFADVIIGAPGFSNGQTNEGRAFVYHGSATGLGTSPAWTAESNQGSAVLGQSVASAGDVNGDGYGDVIVGARLYDNGQTDEGRAFVYHGSATGLGTSPAWTAESNQAQAWFSYSVASAGDVNGDGYGDAIVGAEQYDNGQTNEGRAFVYHGSATGLGTSPAWTAESNQAEAIFGRSVASARDVNGDACPDAIVGASTYDNGQTDEGRAYVYHGQGPCPSLTASIEPSAQTVYFNPYCIDWVYPEASFTGSASGGTGPYFYDWAFGDGSSGSGNPISHVYPYYQTTWTVTLTVTDSWGSWGQATATVTVKQVRFC